MTWVFPVEGELTALGHAILRPLALDLCMISNTFNGMWDRDNVGKIMIDPSKGSTIISPFASSWSSASGNTSTTFDLASAGRVFHPVVYLTPTTQDSRLLITAMSTFRVAKSGASPAGGAYLPLRIAFGVEVDGRVVWHSGYESILFWSYAGTVYAGGDIGFPRATVQVDVPAGSHRVSTFIDYQRGTASGANADVELECQFLETMLGLEEVRR